MARTTKERKDRTSLLISVGLHVVLIAGVGYWAWKTGKLEQLGRRVLEWVRTEQKREQKVESRPVQPPPTAKLPPINQGLPAPASSGTRRAVAADAPAAAGDTFFQDMRRQAGGPSTGGPSGPAKAPEVKIAPPPLPKALTPAFRAAGPSTIKQLYVERAKQAAATESFGSEQISKSGVSDAGAIVNKVAGASIVEGKFAVIRGLSDRYVTTTLNGSEIPSADPYRRSASLDLFPAQIIDKVVVAKTFTPDQPGAYTGGGVNIVTKSFPERAFASVSLGGSYNTQATGNERFLTYDGGGLDWAGMDDGTRALPNSLAGKTLTVPPAPVTSGRPGEPEFAQRFADAAFLSQAAKALGPTSFGISREAPPPNQNLAVALGDTTHLFSRPLGVFVGLNYRRDFSFFEQGIARRFEPSQAGSFEISSDYSDTRSVDVVNWGGIVNLAYQWHPNHEVGFNFLYNQNAEDLARQQVGTAPNREPSAIFYQNRLHFTERNLNTCQLKGTDELPDLAHVRLDWLASLSRTSQDEPDVRFFNWVTKLGTPIVGDNVAPEPKQPTRYFRNLDEVNRNVKFDLTVPFRQWTWNEGELKLGFFHSASERTYLDRDFNYFAGYDQNNVPQPWNGNPSDWLTEANVGDYSYRTNTGRFQSVSFFWDRYFQVRESAYTAASEVPAGYVMLDVPAWDKLRLVGGVRAENTDLRVDSRSYLPSSITGLTTNSARLQQADLLPSAGLIYSLTSNLNVRLSYSQTIARPSFRELAAVRAYDPLLDVILEGSPLLRMTAVQNYDVRWEWFPRPGELLSISLFYKQLTDAIERRFITRDGEIVSFTNRPSATVYGLEFEGRKTLEFVDPLLRHFSLGGNLALIESETDLAPEELDSRRQVEPDVKPTRKLYDQSPYILNLDLSYDNPRSGTSATLLYNIAGPRITIAGIATPDVYEQPVPTLDFILSQRLGRHLSVRFTARNLLDPLIERTYGEAGKFLYSSYKKGMTFGLSANYDF
jgi:outer membrane receptor protein involved in Fe transport